MNLEGCAVSFLKTRNGGNVQIGANPTGTLQITGLLGFVPQSDRETKKLKALSFLSMYVLVCPWLI